MLRFPPHKAAALNQVIAMLRRKLSLALSSRAANGARGQATIQRLALQIATLEELRDMGRDA